jgi:hypothetical protein
LRRWGGSRAALHVAAFAWIAAYFLFAAAYWRVFTGPRL